MPAQSTNLAAHHAALQKHIGELQSLQAQFAAPALAPKPPTSAGESLYRELQSLRESGKHAQASQFWREHETEFMAYANGLESSDRANASGKQTAADERIAANATAQEYFKLRQGDPLAAAHDWNAHKEELCKFFE